jgi:hypothetical protein
VSACHRWHYDGEGKKMSNDPDDLQDALALACALIGRFQYHFARVEQKVDQAVIKLLDLDEKAASIVTGSVDFAKKLNFVRTYAFQQAGNQADRNFAEETCKDVFSVNTDRQLVIHSSFEPAAGGGVQFKRTVANDGRVRVHDQIWDDVRFSKSYQKMRTLEAHLDQLIKRLKPDEPAVKWFIPGLLPELPAFLQPASSWVPMPPVEQQSANKNLPNQRTQDYRTEKK